MADPPPGREGGVASLSPDTAPARRQLVALGRRYDSLGWVLGTSGNLSARVTRPSARAVVVVSASGRHKGLLTDDDFVEVDLDGELVAAGPGARPSAETAIHLAVYRRIPSAAFALHVHTVASTRLRPTAPGVAAFSGIEMIKGYGLWDEGAVARLPLFDNHGDVRRIAGEVDAHLAAPPWPEQVPALVVRGHGITAWGPTAHDADRHVEVTEFLCRLATT